MNRPGETSVTLIINMVNFNGADADEAYIELNKNRFGYAGHQNAAKQIWQTCDGQTPENVFAAVTGLLELEIPFEVQYK